MKDTLPTAYIRAYMASCLRCFAKIQPCGWTSDMLRTCHALALKLIMFQKVKVTSSRGETYGH